MFHFPQNRLSSYRRMASPAKKKTVEREDIDYDPGTSGSEAGTPRKGRKKKETPDPGLTMGTDIEDLLKPDGRQVEVELDNVRIDQEKTKGQIRRKDTKLLQKCIESLEAAPPTVSTRRTWLTCCVFPSSVGQSNRSQQGILHCSTFAGC